MMELSSFSGYLVLGDSLLAKNSKTAIFLEALAGMFINVPSGRKNWSICSLIGVSIKGRKALSQQGTRKSADPRGKV